MTSDTRGSWLERHHDERVPPDPAEEKPASYRPPKQRKPRDGRRVNLALARQPTEWKGS